MSVEKHLEETTPVTIIDGQSDLKKEINLKENEETSCDKEMNIAENATTIPKDASELNHKDDSSENLRDWFESLSTSDRLAALGFADGKFVATLALLLSPPWSSKDQQQGSSSVIGNFLDAGINWVGKVHLKDIERLFDTLGDNLSSNMVYESQPNKTDLSNGGCSITEFIPVQEYKVDMDESTAVESDYDMNSDDAYRIRNKDMCSDELNVSEKGHSATKILDQCCAIFPSSFQFVCGKKIDDSYPYITIESQSFGESSSDDILVLFDSMTSAQSMRHFLSDIDANDADSKLWMRRLKLLNSDGQIPIYMVLISRFEHAVRDSFTREQRRKTDQHLAEVFPASESDSQGKVRKGDCAYRSGDGKNPEKVSEEEIVTKLEVTSALNDIFSHSRSVHDLTLTMDSSTLYFFMEPFAEAFGLNKFHPACSKPRILSTTPLSLVLNAENFKKSLDYRSLDLAVKSSFERMQSHGAETQSMANKPIQLSSSVFSDSVEGGMEVESKQKSEDEATNNFIRQGNVGKEVSICHNPSPIVEREEAHDASEIQEKPSQAKSPKKKKKRNKKRKNRKTGNKSEQVMQVENHAKDEELIAEADDALTIHRIVVEDEEVTGELTASILPLSARSFDSADSESSDKVSIQSDASTDNMNTRSEKCDSITVSRIDGRIVVASPAVRSVSEDVDNEAKNEKVMDDTVDIDDGDLWETVEIRSRANRKKGGDRPGHGSFRHFQHSSVVSCSTDLQGGNSKKPKGSRAVASRKKNANRKMVRDILFSVIDSVEDESRKKKALAPAPRPVGNPWKNGPPGKIVVPAQKAVSEKAPESPKKEKTLRDVVIGTHLPNPKKNVATNPIVQVRDVVIGAHLPNPKKNAATNPIVQAEKFAARVDVTKIRDTSKKDTDPPAKNVQMKRTKVQSSAVADQNTAPTYPETVSTNSNVVVGSKGNLQNSSENVRKGDSSSVGTEEEPQNLGQLSVKAEKNSSPSPPLPTLLSPDNANSSTSSVASSLEAPHVVHTHHHSKSTPSTNDVGYHLLDVCDKLSRDMNLFMSRRAIALSPRRRERCDLLTALQSSVSSLWPGRCHVELYGSCAIQLDLPSSDLDVVVVGLDRNLDVMMNQGIPIVSSSRTKSFSSDSIGASTSQDDSSVSKEAQQLHHHHPVIAPYAFLGSHMNADRVMRLAAELESQPWAVQVKAIPTATVPVVKILADPSRLAGTSSSRDWVSHQPQMSTPLTYTSEAKNKANESLTVERVAASVSAYNPQANFLPWRGSDIVKGLLALDITFEGPEHGGIGSTEFSSHVIAEACLESGLHPDATPFVQVLMVLKELLAQRKLNEPYSGGLSSYALLLLILALVRERAFVKEEIERVELQRKAMAAVDAPPLTNSSPGISNGNQFLDAPSVTAASQPHDSERTSAESSSQTPVVAGKTEVLSPKVDYTKDASHAKKNIKNHLAKQGTQSSSCDVTDGTPSNLSSNTWAHVAKKSAGSKIGSKQHNNNQLSNNQHSSSHHRNNQHDDNKRQNSQHNDNDHPNNQHHNKHNGKKGAKLSSKPSFADAVASVSASTKQSAVQTSTSNIAINKMKPAHKDEVNSAQKAQPAAALDSSKDTASTNDAQLRNAETVTSATNARIPVPFMKESSLVVASSFYPQGVNDIIEVLCSGETTAGKLLMHFLLFYGQYFDAQTTAIDISGKHERDHVVQGLSPLSQRLSPFIQRRSPGRIDPITGMLIIDPIVVYDPLEGAENNNVAKRCFAWNSVRWIFSQSYATLSSAVERSATPPATPSGKLTQREGIKDGRDGDLRSGKKCSLNGGGSPWDPSSPLLSCLLSF